MCYIFSLFLKPVITIISLNKCVPTTRKNLNHRAKTSARLSALTTRANAVCDGCAYRDTADPTYTQCKGFRLWTWPSQWSRHLITMMSEEWVITQKDTADPQRWPRCWCPASFVYRAGWEPRFVSTSTLWRCTFLLEPHARQHSNASLNAVPSPSTMSTPIIMFTGSAETPREIDINTSSRSPPIRMANATQSGLKHLSWFPRPVLVPPAESTLHTQ